MTREEPSVLLKHKSFVLFVETSVWERPRNKEFRNHFFARHKDVFWELIKEYNIAGRSVINSTDTLTPLDDTVLNEKHRISFMYYCADEHGGDDDITNEEMEEGKISLINAINNYRPKVVCFVGRKTYEHFFEKKRLPNYGLQRGKITSDYQNIEEQHWVCVLPGTLASVKYKKKDMLPYWRELGIVVDTLRKSYE